jgi:hypothetical protein
MKLLHPSHRSHGSAVAIMIVLLALMTAIAAGTRWSLIRLRAEITEVERRQALRVGETNQARIRLPSPDLVAPTNAPAP